MRATMNATANVVNAGHTVQPRAAKSNATNAVMAPKPALVSAKPSPGSQTAATTLVSEWRTRAVGATRRSGQTSMSVAKGSSVVASAIAVKP